MTRACVRTFDITGTVEIFSETKARSTVTSSYWGCSACPISACLGLSWLISSHIILFILPAKHYLLKSAEQPHYPLATTMDFLQFLSSPKTPTAIGQVQPSAWTRSTVFSPAVLAFQLPFPVASLPCLLFPSPPRTPRGRLLVPASERAPPAKDRSPLPAKDRRPAAPAPDERGRRFLGRAAGQCSGGVAA